MSKVNRLGKYNDVKVVLDAAIASGGGEIDFQTRGEAVRWRQRAYEFRKMYAEVVIANSPYDALTLPRIPDESTTVTIRIPTLTGQFRPFGGMPLTFAAETAPIPDDDPAMIAAREFKKRMGITDPDDDPSDLGDNPL